jgi:hypothetical protein
MTRPLGLGIRRLRIGPSASAPPIPFPPPSQPSQALLVTELGHLLITETGAAIAVEQP